MNSRKRTSNGAKTEGGTAQAIGRKGPFGNILQDDPYTAQILGLLRKAKSGDEVEARTALVELFYRFRLRLPLEEARLRHALPWNREALQN